MKRAGILAALFLALAGTAQAHARLTTQAARRAVYNYEVISRVEDSRAFGRNTTAIDATWGRFGRCNEVGCAPPGQLHVGRCKRLSAARMRCRYRKQLEIYGAEPAVQVVWGIGIDTVTLRRGHAHVYENRLTVSYLVALS